ncbi:hypothetical protein BN59_00848 [Legionella massiliensis]|uniref:Hemerythrin-like domain-containing protein n=1 Tax=Legionella massiliensis TaxID=1034943 RepID=A0A078KXU1_9GAMM|nr:hemerythrin domain-containing protein [Legionella massiliensis]CDZ76574.1 hypothetical protein BN59_00848 [Legionella massiliensis]CEE12312.1 hypothetical protein BN1094_00848 [Legionella massiliensis]
MKTDLYTLIHKVQRQRLFELSIRIGKTDFSEQSEGIIVKNELKMMIIHLRKHAADEETFIHPLYCIANDKLTALETQHEKIDELLAEIENIINDKQSTCFLYGYFNQFIAMYLQHTAEEERLQQEILWKFYSEEELSAVMTSYRASLSTEKVLDNLQFMLPCLSVGETINILKNMAPAISQQLFQRAPSLLQDAFASHELAMIRAAL